MLTPRECETVVRNGRDARCPSVKPPFGDKGGVEAYWPNGAMALAMTSLRLQSFTDFDRAF